MTRPLLAAILVLVLLSACVPAPTPTVVAVQPLPTLTPLPTPSPVPTDTPSPTATSTATPTQTPAPSLTPTATPTPEPRPTKTPTPDPDPDGDSIRIKHEVTFGTDPEAPDPWHDPAFLKTTLGTLALNGIFARNYVNYNQDQGNKVQSHDETSAFWSGDSKDLSIFVQQNLAHHQVDAWVIDVHWNIQGESYRAHSLPLVRRPDGWWYMSSDPRDMGKVYGPFERLESVAGRFEPRWERIVGIDALGNEMPVILR